MTPAPATACVRVAGFSMADARTGTLFGLFVRPACEGRGHGRALLEAAERWLFDAGAAGWTLAGEADLDDVRYEKTRR